MRNIIQSLKQGFILSFLLVCNVLAATAQTIPAANHNFGCVSNSDTGLPNENNANVQTILPSGEGNRATPSELAGIARPSAWWNIAGNFISTVKDTKGHDVYKFTPAQGVTECQGGFDFGNVNDNGQYLNISADNTNVHVALYLSGNNTNGKAPSVKVRIATPGGNGVNKPFQQYQIDSKSHTLQAGWNYLNLRVEGFNYDRISDDNNKHFDATKLSQVGLVFSDVNDQQNIYVDDIYFYTYFEAANHNLGCSASTGDGSEVITGATNIQTILSAGDRAATINPLEQQIWDGASSQGTTQDSEGHTIYKFIPAHDYSNGGFYFQPNLDVSKYNTYLHVAIYAVSETHAQIRLATPGGNVNGHYEQYQVNSTAIALNPGWNYLNLQLDVYAKNRRTSEDGYGFEYWFEADQNEAFNFDLSKVQQVGFVVSEANHKIYIDDTYFYELPYTTVDNDGENIDWNTTSGATDQVKTVFKASNEPAEDVNNPIKNAFDKNNATYYGLSRDISKDYSSADNAYYFVAELINPVTVSDVEMVWGNGYPMHYEAYAVKKSEAPNKSNDQWTLDEIKSLCKADGSNRLFTHDNEVVSYEPYYNTTSELDKIGDQNGETKYVVIKMWEPMGSTFGFKLDEIHVGAYDDEYYTVDHLSAPELNFNTEKYNQEPLVLTVRNKRNAILTNGTISNVEYKVEDDNDRYVNIDREGDQTNVWASKPGNYVIDITGSVEGVVVPNTGKVKLDVNRDWRGEKTNTKSLIQDIPDDNFSATNSQSSTATETYNIQNIKDDKLGTRWSSGEKASTATNQYIAINLGDNKRFQIRDLEFIWERAYPGTYAVYGFSEMPDTANVTYDAFKTANGNHLLYEANLPKGRDYFPYRDLHVSGTDTNEGEVNNSLYDSQYLVVAFKEPIQQENSETYGVSLWELYGQAADYTEISKMTEIHANNMSMFFDSRDFFKVHGIYPNGEKTDTIPNLNDATFDIVPTESTKGYNSKYIPTSKVETTTDAGTTIYNVYANIDGKELKIAEIWDAGNNTYAIKTEDSRIAGRTFNIGVKYVREDISTNNEYTASFALTILKKPMDLAANSTPRNLVFDDGYYVKERLEKYASPEVLTVDMRNVDFTAYDNQSLGNLEIPAPRDLNLDKRGGSLRGDATYNVGKKPSAITENSADSVETVSGAARRKMNPNAIYYVNQNAFNADNTLAEGVHGENVALMDNRDNTTNNWYIENLRVFDGYDFAPEDPSVNPKGTDNEGKIYAHNAIFYTNIPERIESTLILPFDVRSAEVSNINFYVPDSLKMAEKGDTALITVKPFTLSETSHPMANTMYVVEAQKGAQTFSTTGGYAVQMLSTSYKKDNEVVEVAKAGSTTEINISGVADKAKIVGAFMRYDIPQDGHAHYLYSASEHAFMPAGSDFFNFDPQKENHNDDVETSWKGQDLRNVVLPFYVYLNIPESAPSLSDAAKIGFAISGRGGTTGINSVISNDSDGIDSSSPMYDLMGRRVNKSYRGIVIQNGKKHLMK